MGDCEEIHIRIIKEGKKINLMNAPVDDVLEHLNCTGSGLSSEEAAQRLQIYGYNKPPEQKKESDVIRFLSFLWNAFSWSLEAAALMAITMPEVGGTSPDWEVFLGILLLLLVNSSIGFLAQNKARNAAAQPLNSALTVKAKVLRDGRWTNQDATLIVPGDRIFLQWGDIVPADARILCGEEMSVYHDLHPGRRKFLRSELHSGSDFLDGEAEAVVIHTGNPIFQPLHHGGSNEDLLNDQGISLVGRFCIYLIAVGLILELIIMLVMYRKSYTDVIGNFLVLLVGGMQFMMPTVISISLSVASQRASEQGAITRGGPAIFWKLAMIDMIFCSNSGILTSNKLMFDRNRIEVFESKMDKEQLILLAARSSKIDHQDAIDAAIMELLADPHEARANIKEVHFLPFHRRHKQTVLTYVDGHGCWHRASKGRPDQIMELCNCPEDLRQKVRRIIEEFARDGLQSLAVAQQEISDNTEESIGLPWQFLGLMPYLDPLRDDCIETLKMAHMINLDVTIVTACDTAITRETCRRLGLGSTVHSFSSYVGMALNGQHVTMKFAGISEVDLYEKVEFVLESKKLSGRKFIMIGGGRHNKAALWVADIGICFADSADVCKTTSDIILTEPKLCGIISIIHTSRAIFERIRGYTVCAVSTNTYVVLASVLIMLRWNYNLSPVMILIISILNYGAMMAMFLDPVKSYPMTCRWKVKETIVTGLALGTYLVLISVAFFWFARDTNSLSDMLMLKSLRINKELMAALFLQMSISSQVLLFVATSERWFFWRCFGHFFIFTSVVSQIVSTLIAVYADWGFACIEGVGWHWAGFIWIYTLLLLIAPLQLIKVCTVYIIHEIDSHAN